MKSLKLTIFLLIVCCIQIQAQTSSYSFKKGEILDILLITTKPEKGPLFDRYKKTAFPVAQNFSYQPQGGFKIATTTQGNLQPETFVIGKWASLSEREQFLADIVSKVPDFHQQRREIWSIFAMTYYEMPRDITFELNKDKYIVVTSYWGKSKKQMKQFRQSWLSEANQSGARNVLELQEGNSPYAYFYQPDWVIITEWNDQEAYEAFRSKEEKLNHKGLYNVSEFVLE